MLDRAPRRTADDRLLAIIAGMRHADPDRTLAGIAKRLEHMRERTLRGCAKWYPSSVVAAVASRAARPDHRLDPQLAQSDCYG
ncbi:hypothetical protein [Paracoccus acridae]|uniref:hypothetical protein n=1 Tax=Paracoccus acridae TaxID=1795310 RepID=UPI00166DEE28|nr:hypothetical protein [Paracoccus acridae]